MCGTGVQGTGRDSPEVQEFVVVVSQSCYARVLLWCLCSGVQIPPSASSILQAFQPLMSDPLLPMPYISNCCFQLFVHLASRCNPHSTISRWSGENCAAHCLGVRTVTPPHREVADDSEPQPGDVAFCRNCWREARRIRRCRRRRDPVQYRRVGETPLNVTDWRSLMPPVCRERGNAFCGAMV